MPRITRRPLAEADILDIWDYIADDNVDAADLWINRLDEQLRLLATQPLMGRARDELARRLRHTVCRAACRDAPRKPPADGALYDAVTTRVFPRLKHDRLALKLNGKDDNLRRAEFVGLATTAGLRAADPEGAIDEMSQRLRGAIDRIALPSGMEFSNDAKKKVAEVLHICRTRRETIK